MTALGCAKINLQVRREASAAIGFYERFGFRPDDVVSFGKRLEADGGSWPGPAPSDA